jgi:hypothetical protein
LQTYKPTVQLWEAKLNDWVAAMAGALDDDESAYVSDPHLFLWDLLCNVVVTEAGAPFVELARRSPLNPANVGAVGHKLLAAAVAHAAPRGPLVLGVQEWPTASVEDSVEATMIEHCAALGCRVAVSPASGSVALVYHSSLGGHRVLTGDGLIDPVAVMEGCLASKDAAKGLTAKDRSSLLETTAPKTMAVRIGEGLSVVVMHAKEPKSAAAAAVLAAFVQAVGDMVPSPWVCCADTNISASKPEAVFHATLEDVHGRLAQCP